MECNFKAKVNGLHGEIIFEAGCAYCSSNRIWELRNHQLFMSCLGYFLENSDSKNETLTCAFNDLFATINIVVSSLNTLMKNQTSKLVLTDLRELFLSILIHFVSAANFQYIIIHFSSSPQSLIKINTDRLNETNYGTQITQKTHQRSILKKQMTTSALLR